MDETIKKVVIRNWNPANVYIDFDILEEIRSMDVTPARAFPDSIDAEIQSHRFTLWTFIYLICRILPDDN